jgi:NADH:ubiquinone oxidoreductase subunit 2 (subunit N)
VVQGDGSNMANAYASSMFYVVTYVLTTLGTFGVILLLSRRFRVGGDQRPGRPEPAQPACTPA